MPPKKKYKKNVLTSNDYPEVETDITFPKDRIWDYSQYWLDQNPGLLVPSEYYEQYMTALTAPIPGQMERLTNLSNYWGTDVPAYHAIDPEQYPDEYNYWKNDYENKRKKEQLEKIRSNSALYEYQPYEEWRKKFKQFGGTEEGEFEKTDIPIKMILGKEPGEEQYRIEKEKYYKDLVDKYKEKTGNDPEELLSTNKPYHDWSAVPEDLSKIYYNSPEWDRDKDLINKYDKGDFDPTEGGFFKDSWLASTVESGIVELWNNLPVTIGQFFGTAGLGIGIAAQSMWKNAMPMMRTRQEKIDIINDIYGDIPNKEKYISQREVSGFERSMNMVGSLAGMFGPFAAGSKLMFGAEKTLSRGLLGKGGLMYGEKSLTSTIEKGINKVAGKTVVGEMAPLSMADLTASRLIAKNFVNVIPKIPGAMLKSGLAIGVGFPLAQGREPNVSEFQMGAMFGMAGKFAEGVMGKLPEAFRTARVVEPITKVVLGTTAFTGGDIATKLITGEEFNTLQTLATGFGLSLTHMVPGILQSVRTQFNKEAREKLRGQKDAQKKEIAEWKRFTSELKANASDFDRMLKDENMDYFSFTQIWNLKNAIGNRPPEVRNQLLNDVLDRTNKLKDILFVDYEKNLKLDNKEKANKNAFMLNYLNKVSDWTSDHKINNTNEKIVNAANMFRDMIVKANDPKVTGISDKQTGIINTDMNNHEIAIQQGIEAVNKAYEDYNADKNLSKFVRKISSINEKYNFNDISTVLKYDSNLFDKLGMGKDHNLRLKRNEIDVLKGQYVANLKSKLNEVGGKDYTDLTNSKKNVASRLALENKKLDEIAKQYRAEPTQERKELYAKQFDQVQKAKVEYIRSLDNIDSLNLVKFNIERDNAKGNYEELHKLLWKIDDNNIRRKPMFNVLKNSIKKEIRRLKEANPKLIEPKREYKLEDKVAVLKEQEALLNLNKDLTNRQIETKYSDLEKRTKEAETQKVDYDKEIQDLEEGINALYGNLTKETPALKKAKGEQVKGEKATGKVKEERSALIRERDAVLREIEELKQERAKVYKERPEQGRKILQGKYRQKLANIKNHINYLKVSGAEKETLTQIDKLNTQLTSLQQRISRFDRIYKTEKVQYDRVRAEADYRDYQKLTQLRDELDNEITLNKEKQLELKNTKIARKEFDNKELAELEREVTERRILRLKELDTEESLPDLRAELERNIVTKGPEEITSLISEQITKLETERDKVVLKSVEDNNQLRNSAIDYLKKIVPDLEINESESPSNVRGIFKTAGGGVTIFKNSSAEDIIHEAGEHYYSYLTAKYGKMPENLVNEIIKYRDSQGYKEGDYSTAEAAADMIADMIMGRIPKTKLWDELKEFGISELHIPKAETITASIGKKEKIITPKGTIRRQKLSGNMVTKDGIEYKADEIYNLGNGYKLALFNSDKGGEYRIFDSKGEQLLHRGEGVENESAIFNKANLQNSYKYGDENIYRILKDAGLVYKEFNAKKGSRAGFAYPGSKAKAIFFYDYLPLPENIGGYMELFSGGLNETFPFLANYFNDGLKGNIHIFEKENTINLWRDAVQNNPDAVIKIFQEEFAKIDSFKGDRQQIDALLNDYASILNNPDSTPGELLKARTMAFTPVIKTSNDGEKYKMGWLENKYNAKVGPNLEKKTKTASELLNLYGVSANTNGITDARIAYDSFESDGKTLYVADPPYSDRQMIKYKEGDIADLPEAIKFVEKLGQNNKDFIIYHNAINPDIIEALRKANFKFDIVLVASEKDTSRAELVAIHHPAITKLLESGQLKNPDLINEVDKAIITGKLDMRGADDNKFLTNVETDNTRLFDENNSFVRTRLFEALQEVFPNFDIYKDGALGKDIGVFTKGMEDISGRINIKDGRFEFNADNATTTTGIHEILAHIATELIRTKDRSLFDNIVNELKGNKEFYDEMKRLYPDYKGDKLDSEIMTTALGELLNEKFAGDLFKADATPKTKVQKFVDWIKQVWGKFIDTFRKPHNEEFIDKLITKVYAGEKVSIYDLVDGIHAGVMSGEVITGKSLKEITDNLKSDEFMYVGERGIVKQKYGDLLDELDSKLRSMLSKTGQENKIDIVKNIILNSLETGKGLSSWKFLGLDEKDSAGLYRRLKKGRDTILANNDIAVAKKMEADGINPQKIWEETLCLHEPSGDWVHALRDNNTFISNEKLPINVPNKKIYNLEDILDYDAFYKLYPEARKVPVQYSDEISMHAYYDRKNRKIVVAKDISHIKDIGEANYRTIRSLIHETQHWVQHKEGLVGGTNVRYETAKINQKYQPFIREELHRMRENKLNELLEKDDKLLNEMYDLPENEQFETKHAVLWNEWSIVHKEVMEAKLRLQELSPIGRYNNNQGEIESKESVLFIGETDLKNMYPYDLGKSTYGPRPDPYLIRTDKEYRDKAFSMDSRISKKAKDKLIVRFENKVPDDKREVGLLLYERAKGNYTAFYDSMKSYYNDTLKTKPDNHEIDVIWELVNSKAGKESLEALMKSKVEMEEKGIVNTNRLFTKSLTSIFTKEDIDFNALGREMNYFKEKSLNPTKEVSQRQEVFDNDIINVVKEIKFNTIENQAMMDIAENLTTHKKIVSWFRDTADLDERTPQEKRDDIIKEINDIDVLLNEKEYEEKRLGYLDPKLVKQRQKVITDPVTGKQKIVMEDVVNYPARKVMKTRIVDRKNDVTGKLEKVKEEYWVNEEPKFKYKIGLRDPRRNTLLEEKRQLNKELKNIVTGKRKTNYININEMVVAKAKQLVQNKIGEIVREAQYASYDDVSRRIFKQKIGQLMDIYPSYRKIIGVAGRTLGMLSNKEGPYFYKQLLSRAEKDMAFIKGIDPLNAKQLDSLIKNYKDVSEKPDIADKVNWFWYNSALGSLTFGADQSNIIGNLSSVGLEIMLRYGWDKNVKVLEAMKKVWRPGGEFWKTATAIAKGEESDMGKFADIMQGPESHHPVIFKPKTMGGVAFNTLLPTTRLAIEDVFFRSLVKELQSQKVSGILQKQYGMTPDKASETIDTIMKNKNAFGLEGSGMAILKEQNNKLYDIIKTVTSIEREALHSVFQQPLGKFGKAAMGLMTKSKFARIPFGMAFFRIMINLAKNSTEYTPIGGAFRLIKNRDKLSKTELNGILIRTIAGTAMMSAITAAVLSGAITISGHGPRDKNEKLLWEREGWKEGSVGFVTNGTGKFIRYGGIEPLSNILFTLGDIVDHYKYDLKPEERKDYFNPELDKMVTIAGDVMWSYIRQFSTDNGYLTTVKDITEGFKDEDSFFSMLKKYTTQYILPIPKLNLREYIYGPKVMKPTGLLGEMLGTYGIGLEPAINQFGEERISTRKGTTMGTYSMDMKTPNRWLLDNNITIGIPNKKYGDKEMDEETFKKFKQETGKEILSFINKNSDKLSRMVNAKEIVSTITEGIRDEYRNKLKDKNYKINVKNVERKIDYLDNLYSINNILKNNDVSISDNPSDIYNYRLTDDEIDKGKMDKQRVNRLLFSGEGLESKLSPKLSSIQRQERIKKIQKAKLELKKVINKIK